MNRRFTVLRRAISSHTHSGEGRTLGDATLEARNAGLESIQPLPAKDFSNTAKRTFESPESAARRNASR